VFGILTLSFINYIDKTLGVSDDEPELALKQTDELSEDELELDLESEDDVDSQDEAYDDVVDEQDEVSDASIDDQDVPLDDGIDDQDEVPDYGIDDLDEATDSETQGGIGSVYGDYTVTDILPTGDQIIDTSGLIYEVTGGDGIITVSGGSTVLILNGTERSGLTSQLRIQGTANVTLFLVKGTANTFHCTGTGTQPNDYQAGIQVDPDAALTIKGHGTLNATGGIYSAGIGGIYTNGGVGSPGSAKSGTITIQSGTVTAIGGSYAAGIGGGNKGPGGTTRINGGKVKAVGGDNGGAGIGGGGLNDTVRTGSQGSTGGAIYITGGQVTAWAYDYSAGIGGGAWSDGGYIEVSGGIIEAISSGGAGIGAGKNSKCGFIDISAGTVYAEGGLQAAGIGNDSDVTGGRIIITGGVIHAKSNDVSASGVGGGEDGSAKIEISGGSVLSIGPRIIGETIKDMIRVNSAPTSGFDDRNVYLAKIKLINENNGVLSDAVITVAVSGNAPDVSYVYSATTNKDGIAYLWLPNGTHDILLYNPGNGSYTNDSITVNVPLDTVQYDPADGFTEIKATSGIPQWSLSASPLNVKVYDDTVKLTVDVVTLELGADLNNSVAGVKWYRESVESTKNTEETFDVKYEAAVSDNKGIGGTGNVLDIINNSQSERRYGMDIDQNGRYWVQLHFISSADGKDVYLADYIDIDNIYTSTDVYVRDWNESDDIEIKPYTEITLSGGASYGIPFDLSSGEILTAPSLGFDTVTYKHNDALPTDDWDMTVPEETFEITEPDATFSLIKLGPLVDVNEDKTINSDETTKFYTVMYALTVNGEIDLSIITNAQNNSDYYVDDVSGPYIGSSAITNPIGGLVFTENSSGKTFNIIQSRTVPNPVPPNEKQGSTYIKNIFVESGADITLVLDTIHIYGSIYVENGAVLTIKLSGVNYIRTSIHVPPGAKLTIDSLSGIHTSDRLVMPTDSKAGGTELTNKDSRIGGLGGTSSYEDGEDCGMITINGGGIDIISFTNGAVIGGGGGFSFGSDTTYNTKAGNGGTIVINGGIISIQQHGSGADSSKSYGGACIGGGGANSQNIGGSAGNILITGGKITLKQYTRGAGIGGGTFGPAGNVVITGGDIGIEVIRDSGKAGNGEGAGIGNGSGYNLGTGSITISGGTINVSAYNTAIGRVQTNSSGSKPTLSITITGGYINAKSEVATGIGYLTAPNRSKITITGGTVIAEGSVNGTGIGCALADVSDPDDKAILELGPNANVRAYSGGTVAAINVLDEPNNAYYVNASLNNALPMETTLRAYEKGNGGALKKTLTLPKDYKHFAYSSDRSTSRTDNIYVFVGSTLTYSIVRVKDNNPDIFSINSRTGYSAYTSSNALPVKTEFANHWTVTEKYVDVNGNSLEDHKYDSEVVVVKNSSYSKSIPIISGCTARGYRLDLLTNNLIESPSVTINSVIGNRIVYFVYDASATLTVSATVDGIYADKTKAFKFWVYFADSSSHDLDINNITFDAVKQGMGIGAAGEPLVLHLTQYSDGTAVDFMLKHNQTITIKGVSLDYKIRIVEDIPTPSTLYGVSFTDSKEGPGTGNDTGGISSPKTLLQMTANRSFSFTNERVVNVPVGINSGNMEAILLMAKIVFLATLCVAILTLFIRRRQENN